MTESTKHRLAFDMYWELGASRSIERLHQLLEKSGKAPTERTLYEWSRRYHWQDRLVELERKAREADDEAHLTALREMADRQAREALLLQQKGAEWLTGLGSDQVTAEAAIRAVVEGARLERLVRGEPTDRTDHQGQINARLEALDHDELDTFIDFAERTLAGEGPTGTG